MPSNLLEYFRDYLVAQGVVRKPATASALYPLILAPEDRAFAPGELEGNDIYGSDEGILSAFYASGPPPAPLEGLWLRNMGIELWYCVIDAELVYPIEKSVRTALLDKQNFSMAGLTINDCQLLSDLQEIRPWAQAGYAYRQVFIFNLAAPGP